MPTNLQFLDLPFEIIHNILFLLSPIHLATCQLVNKHLNAIISESVILQYSIALALALATDNPFSKLPLHQKLENIRSSEAAWTSLQPKFIASLPVRHRTSGIYDLSAGTYLMGNVDRLTLQYLQLPTRVGEPLDWRKISVDKTIIDMGFCVFEHDLIAIITGTPNTTQSWLWNIEMTLLEYSTGRPHPKAKNSTIFVTSCVVSSSILPSLMCEIVGENLVLILNFMLDQGDRIFIWNWCSNVLKTTFSVPSRTHSGILFLEEDLIILPNATSASFDFFRIPTKPTADSLKPLFSLQLPSLANGVEIDMITCRAEPNPISSASRINKRQCAQERADLGLDEDPFSPKRGFLASGEDAICLFRISFREIVVVGAEVINVQFDPTTSYTLFVHRSSFLKLVRQYEEISDPPLPADEATSMPRRIAWADWGPPVSRWFNAIASPSRWITTSAGQRSVMIYDQVGVYRSPITILDFNPFNIRKMKAKIKREKELAKEKGREKGKYHQSTTGVTEGDESVLPRETLADPADEEGRPLLSDSEFEETLSSSARSQAQTEFATGQDMEFEDESDSADEMDVGEDEDHEFFETMDDDSDPLAGQIFGDSDSDSMPGLESVFDSDDECNDPSTGYTTNPSDYRHPGLAVWRVFESPSRESAGTFAEEVEGRLPYIECISEREYEYQGVLLDEERILGLMTDTSFRISNIDIFYFG